MTHELATTALEKITKICAEHKVCLERVDIRYDIFHGSGGSFSVFSHMDVMVSHKNASDKHFHTLLLPEIKERGFEVEGIDVEKGKSKKREYTATMRIK